MKFLLLILLLTVSSCSTYIRTLSTRMISPEANGRTFMGNLDLRGQSFQTYQMDFSGNTTNKPLTPIDGTYGAGPYFDMGALKRLDFFVIPSLVMSPPIFGGKVQFLGDPRLEAKKGNFSASLMAALGGMSQSRTDGDDDIDVIDGDVDKISLEMEHKEVGLIVGYRFADNVLAYMNGIVFDEKVEGKVTNNAGTLTDAKFNYNGHGLISSSGLIVYFGRMQLKADYSHTKSRWSNTRSVTSNTYNGSIGSNW